MAYYFMLKTAPQSLSDLLFRTLRRFLSCHLSISPATFYILLVSLPVFLRTFGLMIGVQAFLARRLGRSVEVAYGNRELAGLKREASCWGRDRH